MASKLKHGKAGVESSAKQPTLGGKVIQHPLNIPMEKKHMTADHHKQMADYHEKQSEWNRQMGRPREAKGHGDLSGKYGKRAEKAEKQGVKETMAPVPLEHLAGLHRQAGHTHTMPKSIQTGAKGGKYYISSSGEKVYLN